MKTHHTDKLTMSGEEKEREKVKMFSCLLCMRKLYMKWLESFYGLPNFAMFYFFLLFIFIVKVVFGLYYISSSQAKPPDSLTTIFDESKRIGYLASEDDIIYDFHLSFGVFILQKIS